MKSQSRLRRPESWVPLSVALLASFALGWFVEPLFDGDVGAYIQSVSTMLLVAVTITYVLATQALAETAERQLVREEAAPVLQAVNKAWRAFAAIQSDLLNVNKTAHDYEDLVLDDPNNAGTLRNAFVESARRLDSFRGVLLTERHLLPREVGAKFGEVLEHVDRSMHAALALDDAIWQELTDAMPRTPNRTRIPGSWLSRLPGTRPPALTWESYTQTGWLSITIDLIIELNDVCAPYFPTIDGQRSPKR